MKQFGSFSWVKSEVNSLERLTLKYLVRPINQFEN